MSHPTQPAITALAWVAILWAFWLPVFSRSALEAVLWSPMAVVPHPTLIVAAALAWMSARGGSPTRNWLVAGTAAGLALYDVVLGHEWSSLVLLVLAIGILVEQRLQTPAEPIRERGSDPGADPSLALYDAPDAGDAEPVRRPTPARPAPGKSTPPASRKGWKLK